MLVGMPTLTTVPMDPAQPLRAFIYDRNSRVINGVTTSTEAQRTENRRLCEREGWQIAGEFSDPGRSASRYARKAREDYERMLTEIQQGRCDVLVIWEASRGYRSTKTFIELRDLLEKQGVKLCYNGRSYDPTNRSDRFMMLIDAGRAEDEADAIRDRNLRTTRLNAERGGVHGRVAFGCRREYDADTGILLRQVPDEAEGPVVVEATERVAAGEALRAIAKDFKQRGLPGPPGGWTPAAVRRIVLRPSNIGLRSHNGTIVGEGNWKPILEGEEAVAAYYAAVKLLSNPARRSQRDIAVKHLLSGIALCGACAAEPQVIESRLRRMSHGKSGREIYTCLACNRVSITKDVLDDYVQSTLLEYVERPEFAASLAAPARGASTTALAQAAALEQQLADARKLASTFENGRFKLSAQSLADMEAQLLPRIDAARQTAQDATVPLVLRRLARPDARAVWDEDMGLPERRSAIRALVKVTLNPAGKGVHQLRPGRVTFDWSY